MPYICQPNCKCFDMYAFKITSRVDAALTSICYMENLKCRLFLWLHKKIAEFVMKSNLNLRRSGARVVSSAGYVGFI